MRNTLRRYLLLLPFACIASLAVSLAICFASPRVPVRTFSGNPYSAAVHWSRLTPNSNARAMFFSRDAFGSTQANTVVLTTVFDMPDHTEDLLSQTPAWARDFVWPWLRRGEPLPAVTGVDWRLALAYGWPFRCLWVGFAPVAPVYNASVKVMGGIERPPLATGSPFPRAIPYRVMLPGLLGNSLIYGLLGLTSIRGLAFVRAIHRRRRGRCAACGYDLRATPAGAPCPECGHSAIRR